MRKESGFALMLGWRSGFHDQENYNNNRGKI